MTRRQFSGGAARTTITGSIGSSGGGTVILADATGWPDGSVGPFHVVVDPGGSAEEKILMDSRVGTTLTFSTGGRGADGTVATSHSTGALIWHVMAAVDFDEANAHINSSATAHTAAQISFTPVGAIAATTVQAAIAELEGEAGDARLDALEAADIALDGRLDSIDANGWVTPARYAPTVVLEITRAAAQPFGNGVTSFVTFDTEITDTHGMFTASSDTITVAAAAEGLWLIEPRCVPAASPTSYCAIGIFVGSTAFTGGNHIWGTAIPIVGASFVTRLGPAGTVLKVFITNMSSGTINYAASLKITRLAA